MSIQVRRELTLDQRKAFAQDDLEDYYVVEEIEGGIWKDRAAVTTICRKDDGLGTHWALEWNRYNEWDASGDHDFNMKTFIYQVKKIETTKTVVVTDWVKVK